VFHAELVVPPLGVIRRNESWTDKYLQNSLQGKISHLWAPLQLL